MTRPQWARRIGGLVGVGALCMALIVGLAFLARAATARTAHIGASTGDSHLACDPVAASSAITQPSTPLPSQRATPAATTHGAALASAPTATPGPTPAPTATATTPGAAPGATPGATPTIAPTVSASTPTTQPTTQATVPASDADTDWAQFGFDAQGGRCNPNETSLSLHTAPELKLAWSDANGAYTESSPVVAHGVVYVASDNPHTAIRAFSAKTGELLWLQVLPNVVETSPTTPAVANGIIYVGSADTLYAFDATTGAPLWGKATGNTLQGWPVVDSGLVYISSQDGHVYALDATTGAPAWTAPLSLGGEPAVATTGLTIDGGVLYIGAGQSLYAFDAATGHLVWRIAAPGGLSESAPVVGDGVVYIGGFDGRLYALDARTGATRWSALTGNVINASAAVAYGLVVVGSGDGVVYAFHATTGALAWKRTIGGVIFTADAVANGVVYAATACDCGASSQKFLFALDASTGKPLWSYAPGYPEYSAPTVADGYLYASAYTGLFAFTRQP